MSTHSLVEELGITLADLMPLKGVVVSIEREALPYRISERLHDALRELTRVRGDSVSGLVAQLRDELHGEARSREEKAR